MMNKYILKEDDFHNEVTYRSELEESIKSLEEIQEFLLSQSFNLNEKNTILFYEDVVDLIFFE